MSKIGNKEKQKKAFEKEQKQSKINKKLKILESIIAQEGGLHPFMVLLGDYIQMKDAHLTQFINNRKFFYEDEEKRMAAFKYQKNGTHCIKIFNSDNTPFATLTVCMDDVHVATDEFLVKTWTKNKDLVNYMRNLNWIVDTGRRIKGPNDAIAEVWKIKGI